MKEPRARVYNPIFATQPEAIALKMNKIEGSLLKFLDALKNSVRSRNRPLHLEKSGQFEKLLMEHFNIRSFAEVSDPVIKMGLEFAASTVQRGESTRRLLSKYTEIKGKRCLDVGCAYGGFPLAFERAGAVEAVGIDVSADFLAFSDALKQDHRAKFTTHRKSILDRNSLVNLGRFDIITCNDVIEHVQGPDVTLVWTSALVETT